MMEVTEPFRPNFDDTLQEEMICGGEQYQKMITYKEKATLPLLTWNRVVFEFEVERVAVAEEDHKDLLFHIYCNRDAPDPHWRCAFTATVDCDLRPSDVNEIAEQTMTANRKNFVMTVPVMRIPTPNPANSAVFRITLRMTSWSGIFSQLRQSFEKSELTDATLVVQGTPIHIIRSTLAQHSEYFYNIFYNRSFMDASKNEYIIDDVPPETMTAFLRLLYPRIGEDDVVEIMPSPDEVEDLLILADKYTCDTVKRIMEKYLMGEQGYNVNGLTLPRRLLLADRYRLSAVCSDAMRRLTNEDELWALRQSAEYDELSDALKAAILDSTTQQPRRAPECRAAVRFDDNVVCMDSSDEELMWNLGSIRRNVQMHRRPIRWGQQPAQQPAGPGGFLNVQAPNVPAPPSGHLYPLVIPAPPSHPAPGGFVFGSATSSAALVPTHASSATWSAPRTIPRPPAAQAPVIIPASNAHYTHHFVLDGAPVSAPTSARSSRQLVVTNPRPIPTRQTSTVLGDPRLQRLEALTEDGKPVTRSKLASKVSSVAQPNQRDADNKSLEIESEVCEILARLTSDPRDTSWRSFTDDLARMVRLVPTLALSTRMSNDLDRGTQFLEAMTRETYDRLGSGTRIPLHASLRTLLDVAQGFGSTADAVRQFLVQVDSARLHSRVVGIRKDAGPAKRKKTE